MSSVSVASSKERNEAFVEQHARATAAALAAEEARIAAMDVEERAAHEAAEKEKEIHEARKDKMLAKSMKGYKSSARGKLLGGRRRRANKLEPSESSDESPTDEREAIETEAAAKRAEETTTAAAEAKAAAEVAERADEEMRAAAQIAAAQIAAAEEANARAAAAQKASDEEKARAAKAQTASTRAAEEEAAAKLRAEANADAAAAAQQVMEHQTGGAAVDEELSAATDPGLQRALLAPLKPAADATTVAQTTEAADIAHETPAETHPKVDAPADAGAAPMCHNRGHHHGRVSPMLGSSSISIAALSGQHAVLAPPGMGMAKRSPRARARTTVTASSVGDIQQKSDTPRAASDGGRGAALDAEAASIVAGNAHSPRTRGRGASVLAETGGVPPGRPASSRIRGQPPQAALGSSIAAMQRTAAVEQTAAAQFAATKEQAAAAQDVALDERVTEEKRVAADALQIEEMALQNTRKTDAKASAIAAAEERKAEDVLRRQEILLQAQLRSERDAAAQAEADTKAEADVVAAMKVEEREAAAEKVRRAAAARAAALADTRAAREAVEATAQVAKDYAETRAAAEAEQRAIVEAADMKAKAAAAAKVAAGNSGGPSTGGELDSASAAWAAIVATENKSKAKASSDSTLAAQARREAASAMSELEAAQAAEAARAAQKKVLAMRAARERAETQAREHAAAAAEAQRAARIAHAKAEHERTERAAAEKHAAEARAVLAAAVKAEAIHDAARVAEAADASAAVAARELALAQALAEADAAAERMRTATQAMDAKQAEMKAKYADELKSRQVTMEAAHADALKRAKSGRPGLPPGTSTGDQLASPQRETMRGGSDAVLSVQDSTDIDLDDALSGIAAMTMGILASSINTRGAARPGRQAKAESPTAWRESYRAVNAPAAAPALRGHRSPTPSPVRVRRLPPPSGGGIQEWLAAFEAYEDPHAPSPSSLQRSRSPSSVRGDPATSRRVADEYVVKFDRAVAQESPRYATPARARSGTPVSKSSPPTRAISPHPSVRLSGPRSPMKASSDLIVGMRFAVTQPFVPDRQSQLEGALLLNVSDEIAVAQVPEANAPWVLVDKAAPGLAASAAQRGYIPRAYVLDTQASEEAQLSRARRLDDLADMVEELTREAKRQQEAQQQRAAVAAAAAAASVAWTAQSPSGELVGQLVRGIHLFIPTRAQAGSGVVGVQAGLTFRALRTPSSGGWLLVGDATSGAPVGHVPMSYVERVRSTPSLRGRTVPQRQLAQLQVQLAGGAESTRY